MLGLRWCLLGGANKREISLYWLLACLLELAFLGHCVEGVVLLKGLEPVDAGWVLLSAASLGLELVSRAVHLQLLSLDHVAEPSTIP